MLTLRLPPEILDHIVDLLQDHPHALNQCCLVSKPWIPRTRKHLFAEVHLSSRVLLKSWKNAFPDPASSPGYHTHTLSVCRTLGDVGGGSWVTSFPRVKQLDFALSGHGPIDVPFAAFHRLSSSIKSLKITFTIPHPHVFNLILSLPLLEDLELRGKEIPTDGEKSEGQQTAVSSPTSPALTGTLILLLFAGMEGGLLWAALLVAACSDTLEYLELEYLTDSLTPPGRINLSGATKLENIVFICSAQSSEWIIVTLETLMPNNRDLRQISIRFPFTVGHAEERDPGLRWSDLDRLLVQICEQYPVRVEVSSRWCQMIESRVGKLFPEMTERGLVDLVDEVPYLRI